MNFKLLLASLFTLAPAYTLPAIPEMEVWSDGTNYRYLLKDWHRDYVDGRISIQQHADILWAAQQHDAKDVFVLVEDSMSYSGTNQKIQDLFDYAPATIEDDIAHVQAREGIDPTQVAGSLDILAGDASPLACLANACQTQNIQHCNIECSQAIDLYQFKNLPVDKKITRQDVLDELADSIADLARCALLKNDYEYFMQEHAELLKIASTATEQEFVDKAMDLRSPLVNAKTAQKLIEWNSIKHGFVCEGANHFKGIKAGLTTLGYKHIQSIGHADVWNLPHETGEQRDQMVKQIAGNALDLRATFKQIFEK